MTGTTETSMRAELVALRRTLARLEEQAGLAPIPTAAPPSGYGLVIPGEIVAADHMNRATSQGVMRFASAAARDAAIPVGDRVDGMVAWTTAERAQWTWNAPQNRWEPLTFAGAYDCTVPGAVPGNGAGTAVTFPAGRFVAAPQIVGTVESSSGAFIHAGAITTAGCTIWTTYVIGTTATRRVNWMALPRPAAGALLREGDARWLDEGFQAVSTMCPTPGCDNQDLPITTLVLPESQVLCGPCGTELRAAVL